MATTIGKKTVATKKTPHGSVAPGAISLVTPPAPPVPTPFVYVARTANVTRVPQSSFLRMDDPVLTVDSVMSVDPPANAPSQSAGGDVVTHAAIKYAVMATGSYQLTAEGHQVCGTGDLVRMNVLTAEMKVAQMQVPLLEGVDFDMLGRDYAKAIETNKAYFKAFPPAGAKQTKAGDPVDLGTGYVVSDHVDLRLPGFMPLAWRRTYSSAARDRRTALGVGGWSHSFEQFLEITETSIRLWNDEGLPVDFPPLGDASATFHRGERLELRRTSQGYEVYGIDERSTRLFSPLPDGRMALRGVVDSYGHAIRLHHEGSRLMRITDSVGREIRVACNGKGRVVRVEVWAAPPGSKENPSLQTWFEYAYHPTGELASHRNVLGELETWDYDGLHRLVKTTARNGISFYYEYFEDTGRCVRTWGDGGLHDIRVEFDAPNGETRTHETSRARRYLVNMGIVCREETFDGRWAVTREYDADGLLVSVGNAAGEKTTYEYDERGNLIGQTDPAGNVATWVCESDRPIRYISPTGLEAQLEYDSRGALVAMAFAGEHHELDLDHHGRLVAARDANGSPWSLAYDDHSNIACMATSRGARTTFSYDALGRPIETADVFGSVSRARYDGRGRLIDLARPDGTALATTYDAVGNTLRTTEGLGLETRFEYSGTGHLAKIIQPDGQVYAFRRDTDERVIEIINPRMETYQFEYDRADQVVAERTFDGRLIQMTYNLAGRVSRIDYPEGEWREFRYDKLGNIVEDRGEDVQITFDRDPLGRIKKAVCKDAMGAVVTEFVRDELGRILAEIQNGRAVQHEYDACGRRRFRTIDGKDRTEYIYDPDDVLVGIRHADSALAIHHDAEQRERVRASKHWRVTSAYDALGRLSSQHHESDGDQRDPRMSFRRDFRYDAAGRITEIHDMREGWTHYRYDATDRVVEADYGRWRETFEYDPAGALVRTGGDIKTGAVERPWSLRPGNVLQAARGVRFVNDGRGRRIQRIEPGGADGTPRATTYGWDTKDRLREVVLPDGTRIRFAYDAFGRRVRKDVLPASRVSDHELGLGSDPTGRRSVEYVWDQDILCEEQFSTGSEQNRRVHVHGPRGVPMLQIEGGKVYGVVADHLGTPKDLIDEAGRVAWHGRHGLFGSLLPGSGAPSSPVESPFRLLGQYSDDELGLHYVRFRYWDPAHARWLSPDPLDIRGGLDAFGFDYAPTLGVDPFGLAMDPFVPHPAHESDTGAKGVHMNTDVKGLEAVVDTDGKGNATFVPVRFGNNKNKADPNGDQAEMDKAREKFKEEPMWRWRLLSTAVDALKQFLTNKEYQKLGNKEQLQKRMAAVKDALAKAIAKKDNGA